MWRGGAGEIDWEGFKSFRCSGGGAGQAGSSASRSSLSARPCVVVLSLCRMFLFCVFACLFYRESLLACQAFAALAMLPFVCVNASACLGLWGCGLVSSPSVVPVRCLRAVNTVESSRGAVARGRSQHTAVSRLTPPRGAITRADRKYTRAASLAGARRWWRALTCNHSHRKAVRSLLATRAARRSRIARPRTLSAVHWWRRLRTATAGKTPSSGDVYETAA